jgi:hypothetical protein
MDVLSFEGQNMGGLCATSIKLLDVKDAGEMPEVVNGEIRTAVGSSGDWVNFPVQDQQSEVAEAPKNGMWPMRLVAHIRKQSGAKTQALYEAGKKRFLLDFTDQNGVRRIAGTPDEGLVIKIKRAETRRQAKEPNEYQIEIAANRRFPIPAYNPA